MRPIGLTTVFQLARQLAHQLLADFEPLPNQRRDDVPLAADDPTQRRFRVASDGILNQGPQRDEQGRLPEHRSLASAARPSDPRALVRPPGPRLSDAAVDGAARHTSPVDAAVTPP
jgi:hypothetical protein